MKNIVELNALLRLIDDPDEEVYQTVSSKIISIGAEVIPVLEDFSYQSNFPETQERIDGLIHQLRFKKLLHDFDLWKSSDQNLLEAVLLINNYLLPDEDDTQCRQTLEKMRRNIWLELNAYLTPIEQVHILNSLVFNYYKHVAEPYNYNEIELFLLSKVLETKNGNALSHTILLLILCESLDIPIKCIALPNQLLLVYIEKDFSDETGHFEDKIKFFIDPTNGKMFSQQDMEGFLKTNDIDLQPNLFNTLSHQKVLQWYLSEISNYFYHAPNLYKDLNKLAEYVNS